MARVFRVSETIRKPVGEVWSRLVDFEQAPRWMKGIDSYVPQGDGPLGEGRGGETVVTLEADCNMGGAWRLLAPLLRVAIRRADSGQVRAFKEWIES